MVSHYQALQGCRMLRSAFQRYDQEEQETRQGCCHNNAAERSRSACSGGRGGGRSAGGFLRGLTRLLPLCRRHVAAAGCRGGSNMTDNDRTGPSGCSSSSSPTSIISSSHHAYNGVPPSSSWLSSSSTSAMPPFPEFRCSKALDKVVQPLERWQTPLSDIDAARIEQLFRPKPKLKAAASIKWGSRHARNEGIGGEESEQGESQDVGAGKLAELVTRLRTQVLERQKHELQRPRPQ
ncbi:hypothetical protein Vretimale_17428 [Volvox reticuliferus]|nr:hypothetical protein Vretifemale_9410 [Volvox reticuliferus]GIM14477.1 hypothetical protein Vretimale_17428 [Volvox reticuliferus]